MRKSPVFYTSTEKLSIIEEHLLGASFSSLARKYNLSRGSKISKWMVTFGILDPPRKVEFMDNQSGSMKESEELKALRLENQRLRKSLAEEKLRSEAYDKLIDVAEDMFKIAIRKKPGTKP